MKRTKCHICHTFIVTLMSTSLHRYTPLILTGYHGRFWRPREGKGRIQLVYQMSSAGPNRIQATCPEPAREKPQESNGL